MELIISVGDSFYESCKRYPKLHGGQFEFIANGKPLHTKLEEIKQEAVDIITAHMEGLKNEPKGENK